MVFWKSTASSFTALFEREALQQPLPQSSRTDENIVFECLSNSPAASSDTTSSLSPNAAAEVCSMTRSVWNDTLRHVEESHDTGKNEILSAAIDRVKTKQIANVAQDTCKKELITVLEKALASHGGMGKTEEHFVGDEAGTILRKRRVMELSDEVQNVKEALRVSAKENNKLECMCEELEGKSNKLSSALKEAKSHIQQLQTENSSLRNIIQDVKAETQHLQEEKRLEKAGKLRAFHKAEVAELVAKQASLQTNRLHDQLRKTENYSNLVQELDRVLNEMTTALTNLITYAELKRQRKFKAQAKLLSRKIYKFLGRFGASLSRNRNEPSGSGGCDRETHVETAVEDENANLEDLLAPNSSNEWPPGMTSDNSNRNRGQNPPGLFRKIAGFLRHENRRIQNDAQDSQARWIDRTPSSGHGVLAEQEYGDGGGQSGNSRLANVMRILSRGIRTKLRMRFQRKRPQVAELTSTAAEALEKNLRAMQNLFESNDEEIRHLRMRLGNIIERSDAFEQGMISERQKRLELEEHIDVTDRQSPVKKTDAKGRSHSILLRHSRLRDKVSVRWSCRWF